MILIPSNTGTTQIPVEVVSFQSNGIAGLSGDTTWALPTYSPGDLVVAFIGAFNNVTAPTGSSTVPSFTRAGYDATNNTSVYYGYLPNSGMNMGYWNSGVYWCFNYVVLRKVKTSSPIGGIQLAYTSGTISSATAPAVTMQKTNGSSALVSFFHTYKASGSAMAMSSITPNGFTNHYCGVQTTPNGQSAGLGIFSKTQATASTETTFAAYSAGTEGSYNKSATIEILAA